MQNCPAMNTIQMAGKNESPLQHANIKGAGLDRYE